MMKFIIPAILALALFITPVSVVTAKKIYDATMNITTNTDQPGFIFRYDDPDFRVKCWVIERFREPSVSCLPWDEVKER